jgi:hypothetical protein
LSRSLQFVSPQWLQSHAVDPVLDIVAGTFDGLERANDRKKLADAAQPLYASLNEQQKSRFAELLFGGDRERDGRRMERMSD